MPGYNRGRAAAKKKKKQQQAKKKAQALARQPSATESLARQASAAARKATEAALADAVEHERLGDAMEVECCAVKNEIAALSSPRGALHPGAAAHTASGAIGPVDADGVERRTDPSDGVGYTFAEFEEAYAERAQELWDLAGRIMLGESGTLGAVQQDSDMLFGGDDAGDGAGGDAPQDGPATLDSVLKYDLMSEQEFGAAADRLVNKFEQLIVSDNFVPFLGQWAVGAMQDAKADRVSELMSAPPCRRPVFATPLTRGRGQARSRGPRTPRRSWSAPPARRRRPPRRPPRRSRPPRRRLPQSPARRRRRTTPR